MLTVAGYYKCLGFLLVAGLVFLTHAQTGMAAIEPIAGEQAINAGSVTGKSGADLAAQTGESESIPKAAKNNRSGSAVPDAADLTITELTTTFSTYSRKGRRILAMESQVKNQGGVAAGSFSIGFYLSVDEVYDAADILASACTLSVPGLAAHALYPATATSSTSCAFPHEAIKGGKYYIIGVVDYAKSVAERDENNNSKSTAMPIAVP